MKKEETTNKEQKIETKSKKSSYSKKKKGKKNILNGIAYVQSTFNNTIVSIADTNGNVVSWASAGQKGFKGSRKSTPYAAQVAADSAAYYQSQFRGNFFVTDPNELGNQSYRGIFNENIDLLNLMFTVNRKISLGIQVKHRTIMNIDHISQELLTLALELLQCIK